MRYYIEIYNFEGIKVVDAAFVELDVILKLLEVYKTFPKIVINGVYEIEGEQDERS